MSIKFDSTAGVWKPVDSLSQQVGYVGLWSPMRELDAWLEKQCQPLWPEPLKPVAFETKRLTSIELCSWLGEKLLREPWKAVVFPIAGQERPLYVQVMDRVPFRNAYEVLFTFNGEAEYLELDALDVRYCEPDWIWAWADEAFIRE